MTTISQVQTSKTVSQQDVAKATLNYDSFLKLLLQQLKSQDPTSPVDQKETLAQLASFSSVEQSIKLNQKLETVMERQRIVEASSMIGRQVKSLSTDEEGVVQSVEISGGKLFAMLEGGVKLDLSGEIRISA
jgi:flagellar basal-body rod modification protein FlgD